MTRGPPGPGDLVSCLMVTMPTPGRFEHFRRSLSDYCGQTHPARELVIVLDASADDASPAVASLVRALAREDIRLIEPAAPLTLGALRNISRQEARGDFVCQWDDDDRHHPRRLERQLSELRRHDGQSVYLTEVMNLFWQSRRLYLTNWRNTPPRAKPSTGLCLAKANFAYPETGPEARLGEDLAALAQLQALGGYHGLDGAAYLYIYTNHGGNTVGDEHHIMLRDRLGLSRGMLLRREASLREELAAFDFGPGAIEVHGSNGLAFTIGTPCA